MRTKDMDDAHRYYIHKEEIIGLHVSMSNAKIDSNGIIDGHEPITMRSLKEKCISIETIRKGSWKIRRRYYKA
jgi:hypothetical protein